MTFAAIGFLLAMAAVIVAGVAVVVIVVAFAILFAKDPNRGREFLGSLAMFARSVFKSRAAAATHKRRTDPPDLPPRVHGRHLDAPTITDFVPRSRARRPEEDQ